MRGLPLPRLFVMASVASLFGLGRGASATTLADAVAQAYRSNPTLQIQRSQLRALDEEYVQAFAAYRPTLSIGATGQYQYERERPSVGAPAIGLSSNAITTGISGTQILYNGGRTAAQVSAAEADILSGREQLCYVEGNTILGVVTAYAAVLRDQSIFAARRLALDAYQAQVDEIEARFRTGTVTRTDVEQAQSQLASSRSDLANAQGSLEASRAAYVAVVGENPGQLETPPPFAGMPGNVDDAFATAADNNPQVLGAIFDEKASKERVSLEKAQYMPSVSAQAFYGYQGPAAPFERRNFLENAGATVSVAIPIFTGGLNASNVRQAQEQDVTRRLQIENVQRSVIQSIATNWNSIRASDRALRSDSAAQQRATGAERGMKIEYRAGLRSTLEVLNEEEQLEAAQIAVAVDTYTDYVARATLLNSLGRLQAIDLTENVPTYDAERNLRRIKNIGAVPTDPIFSTVDYLSEPPAGPPKSSQAPAPAKAPKVVPAQATSDADLPFADQSPSPPPYQPSSQPDLRGPL